MARRRGAPVEAIVWRRHDFRESSRIVTLLTREHGKLRAFAKGAHRHDSVLLGKIDFLTELRVELWQQTDTMPLLGRARLDYEPRGLREPLRYRLAGYLVEAIDRALPDDRADADLYDLAHGGLRLLERCPVAALPQVLLGLEWRLLGLLGAQPALDTCSVTGQPLPPRGAAALDPDGRALCSAEQPGAGLRVSPGARAALRQLGQHPGAQWPGLELAASAVREALALSGRLVACALEHLPRSRAGAVRAALQATQKLASLPDAGAS